MFPRSFVTWLYNPDPSGGSALPGMIPPTVAPVQPPNNVPQQGALPFALPPQQAPATAPAPAPAVAQAVTLPAEEAARLYGLASQLQQFQATAAAEAERLRNEALVAQAKKGEVDQAFATFQQQAKEKYDALERQLLDGERGRIVAGALAKSRASIRPECLTLVEDLIGRGLVAVRDQAGNVHVQDAATGRPAADVITERLASAPYQVFFVPSTTGGANVSGAAATVPTPAPNGGGFATLGEAVVAQWQTRQPTNPMLPTMFGRR